MSAPNDRVRLRRNARRGSYDSEVIRGILDANRVCHVAYVEQGEPRIIPTLYFREGDHVYLHGNRQSALLRHLAGGGQAALSVMSVEGIVVARSGFHCSMNYHSVVLYGCGEEAPSAQQARLLERFVEALIPGHLQHVRGATDQELAATLVVRLPVDEASAKIRTGDPLDDASDLNADVWAGVIPLRVVPGQPRPSADLNPDIAVPAYVRDYEASW